MKRVICLIAASVVCCCIYAQGVVVNPDGTHSVIHGNAADTDETHAAVKDDRVGKSKNQNAAIGSIRMKKIEKRAEKISEREMKRDIRRQERQNR